MFTAATVTSASEHTISQSYISGDRPSPKHPLRLDLLFRIVVYALRDPEDTRMSRQGNLSVLWDGFNFGHVVVATGCPWILVIVFLYKRGLNAAGLNLTLDHTRSSNSNISFLASASISLSFPHRLPSIR